MSPVPAPPSAAPPVKAALFGDVGIYRNAKGIKNALNKVKELQERFKEVRVTDAGRIFNTELLNVWELGNMLEIAEVVAACALNRKESRGGHSREDYPDRDDKNWLRHSFAFVDEKGKVELKYKPVVITRFEPKVRTY